MRIMITFCIYLSTEDAKKMHFSSLQKINEVVVALLYSYEQNPDADLESIVEAIGTEFHAEKPLLSKSLLFCWEIIKEIDKYDDILEDASDDYELERISKIEKQILRLAVHTILHKTLSNSLIIQEAIRLTKKFSSPTSTQFVHAVIHTVIKSIQQSP